MIVCIEKEILGTASSLRIDSSSTFEWSNEDCDIYLGCLGGVGDIWKPVPLDHLARMQGLTPGDLEIVDPTHALAFSSLGLSPDQVPWAKALGRRQLTKRIQSVSQAIQDVLRDTELQRYVKTYRTGRELLRDLQRPTIDVDRLQVYTHQEGLSPSVVSSLLSFMPDSSGLAPPVSYDQVATSTGRLTVASGPRVLTLSREHRDVIRSARGGSIIEVDFVSLEPRFALLLSGDQPPRDIYEDIGSRICPGLARKDVKLAVISALYGSSQSGLVETLGSRAAAKDLVQEVSRAFHVEDLVRRLRDHMSCHSGRLHNHFGRPLPEINSGDKDSKLISHYMQSSCVDIALMGFSQLCSRVSHLGVRPIYVIHDAVLLDVPPGAEEALREECRLGVKLEVGHFELAIKRVS